jgi:hypothetical protein
MTRCGIRVLATGANAALLALVGVAMVRPGFSVEREELPLFVLIIASPILSLVALYWPGRARAVAPAPEETSQSA